jgi:hypothetical protein
MCLGAAFKQEAQEAFSPAEPAAIGGAHTASVASLTVFDINQK